MSGLNRWSPDNRQPHMHVATDAGDYPFRICNRFQDMQPGQTYLWHRVAESPNPRMRQKVYVPYVDHSDGIWEAIVLTAREGGADVIAVTVVSNNGYTVVMENRLGGGVVSLDYKLGGPPVTPQTSPLLSK